LEIDTRAQALVSALIAVSSGSPGGSAAGPEPLPRRSLHRLEEALADLSTPLSLQEMAAIAGLSPAHFSRAFKAAFGLSPVQELRRRRLERAAAELRRSRKPVSAVALDCGFADQSHLTRQFRQHFGVTPAAYRRSFR
jgi:AraC family transcriptional regulator